MQLFLVVQDVEKVSGALVVVKEEEMEMEKEEVVVSEVVLDVAHDHQAEVQATTPRVEARSLPRSC